MTLYDHCRLYDLAFSYRDVPNEVRMLEAWYAQATGGQAARRVLELAAGPAHHALEFARQGGVVGSLDLSPAMCAYARERARRAGLPLEVHQGDMIQFQLEAQFDLAVLLLASSGHLLSLDAMVDHLKAVGRHLRPGGIYVLELNHPGDLFDRHSKTRARWHIRRDGVELEVTWGDEADPFDPVTQITTTTVVLQAREDARETRVVDRLPLRGWTWMEVEAAIRLSGMFDVVAWHGAFDLDTPLAAIPASWRMIPVLRRRAQ